jgi:hypothetical protein
MAECGDAVIPGVILGIAASRGKSVHCETHGWQSAARKLKPFEVVNMVMGRPLGYRETLPDEPLF